MTQAKAAAAASFSGPSPQRSLPKLQSVSASTKCSSRPNLF